MEIKVYCKDCKNYSGKNIDKAELCWSMKERDYFGYKRCEFCSIKNRTNDCLNYDKSNLKYYINKIMKI